MLGLVRVQPGDRLLDPPSAKASNDQPRTRHIRQKILRILRPWPAPGCEFNRLHLAGGVTRHLPKE
jgi:hypothetical protein